jgi:hypothetical protein
MPDAEFKHAELVLRFLPVKLHAFVVHVPHPSLCCHDSPLLTRHYFFQCIEQRLRGLQRYPSGRSVHNVAVDHRPHLYCQFNLVAASFALAVDA